MKKEEGRGEGERHGAKDKGFMYSNMHQLWDQEHGSQENSVSSSVKWEHVYIISFVSPPPNFHKRYVLVNAWYIEKKKQAQNT